MKKMPHEVDVLGYPVDPELRQLEFHLCDLAAEWRSIYRGLEGQEEIIREYHNTLEQLYQLGWDAALDIGCELPDELMPEVYLRRTWRS